MEHPRIQVNAAAWRTAAIAGLVVALALVGALIAQTTLASGPDANQNDPLATLALVLAVLAFLIQIFVYAFQSNASLRSVERSEELASRTQNLLDEIKATSGATQQVLVTQFDRLLDYVVGQPPEEHSVVADVQDDEGSVTAAAPVAAQDWEHIARELAGRAAVRRPDFSMSGPTAADQAVLDFYTAMPTEAEAAELTERLMSMPPLAVAKLRSFRDNEFEARARGQQFGFTMPSRLGDWSPSTKSLIAQGLAQAADGRVVLTDEGRRVARMTGLWPSGDVPPYVMRAVNRLSGLAD